ncbi:MAG: hypothetical protein BWY42_00391 [Candidatus Omnitrophica bacterium ADurb.Bin277]|nr:MAG: hypothetical protein BWY42_00391 [Candidatus Omnitrophica bacterium ADurb.Bin277]
MNACPFLKKSTKQRAFRAALCLEMLLSGYY